MVLSGEGRAHAVFRESMGMDAQLAKHFQYWRKYQSVALQLDDYQFAHIHFLVVQQVMEPQCRVDGQPLRLGLVYQRDTAEVVIQCRLQRVGLIAQVLGQELVFLLFQHVHVGHLDALLLRTSVVVLGLNLHELQSADAIGAEAYLLAVGMSPLVLVVHIEGAGIEVGCVVLQIALAVYLLYEIVLLRQFQQLVQLVYIGHELRVRSVHQFHPTHLFQRDGVKRINQL